MLTAPRIFINVGGRAAVPDLPGIDDVPFLTNTHDAGARHACRGTWSWSAAATSASSSRRCTAASAREVTVVEKGAAPDRARGRGRLRRRSATILEAEGIAVRTGAECIRLAPHADGVAVSASTARTARRTSSARTCCSPSAAGRTPTTSGLDAAGVATDARGYITVDDAARAPTSPGIWALGDCNGRGAFTHTAYNDFEIVAANLLDGEHRQVSDRIPAYALYIDPPLGRVGMTDAEARATGRPLLVATRPMTRVGRAVEKGETQGFMKVVVDAETRRILGAAILGIGGDEAIHGMLDIMNADAPYEVLQRAVPIHPTVSELIPTVLGDLKPA